MTLTAPLRLIIAGGGTGGHVLPAVAVLTELRSRNIPLEALWIGSYDGLERQAATEHGVRFAAIPTGKFRRYLDFRTVPDLVNIPRGFIQARGLVRSFNPQVVLSTGGFVSVPTVLASRGHSPILTHEQTTILGMATKINLRSANLLALSFESTAELVKSAKYKTVVTGNPVRSLLFGGNASVGRSRTGFTDRLPVLFVTGGARGASPINTRIKAILEQLLQITQVVHQTGPGSANPDFAALTALRETLPVELRRRYALTEFVGAEIADIYAMTDLVLCRAGAGTVSELSALGKAAILIPLPLSGGGEQMVNAKALADEGAAVLLSQDDATPERLLSVISHLLGDESARNRIASNAANLGRRDAGARLTDQLLLLAGRS